MQSELFIRLIKAFYNQNSPVIERTMKSIIAEEKKIKHDKLASKLEELVFSMQNEKNINTNNYTTAQTNPNEKRFVELPKNPRNSQSLATLIHHDSLRHHMVLDKETEERFLKVEKEFSARHRLASYNLKPIKRILLYGAPGCGKTMGAERIAWNVGLPLVKVNFDSLISSYMGETASNLRSIFDISKKTPCVLLLDECDIIAKSRLFKQDVGEMSRIVNMLLLLLDEYSADGLLIATTNLEETLDKAIYRRFDDIIPIKLPDKNQIIQIIKNSISVMPSHKNLSLDKLADKLEGMSSASVVAIAENAIKTAVLSLQKNLSMELFQKAIDEHYRISH